MSLLDWLILFLIILIVVGIKYDQYETFTYQTIGDGQNGESCESLNPIASLYKNWGNGGVETGNYPSERKPGGLLRTYNIKPYYPPASVKNPENTLVDQLICKEYAKRTCLDVRGYDRFQNCQTGQYDSCMDGRKRLIWQTCWLEPPYI
jgi:hypothetical protein